jgi:hypothetical protein
VEEQPIFALLARRYKTSLITKNIMKLKIATWNINSINTRINNLVDFIGQHNPDVICLQELKCETSRSQILINIKKTPTQPFLFRDSINNLVSNTTLGLSWYKDGAALVDTSQKIKPTSPGSYTAKTTQNGCPSVLSNPYYYLLTDVINLSADEFIKLAPNPFINQLNFDFVVKGYQRLNIEVFDIANGIRKASLQNLNSGIQINLSQLSGGTYIIKVSSNDSKFNYQFKMLKL